MCDFPHNPSVYCLKYKLSGKPKKISKYKPFECEYQLDEFEYFRPPMTYHFDGNLNKVMQEKFSKASFKGSKRVEEPGKLLSPKCNLNPGGTVVVFLSCYDTYENIPDFRFLTNGKSKDRVYDPWVQKSPEYDCAKVILN